ncbi:hypothetical protein [Kangiella aquimarina]|uniref:Uncharacterized protein n=1 Tax=Kangiella aquimarina TaxID=261965 RepID=A0ABZ0X565_9GAMM|nr:hypothetical protein [Kangiella aquimarina]WQG85526.1 hypothetical protein SR900_01275 [Kangiella aquimarina]
MNLLFISLISIAGIMYVWNWLIAYNHIKEGFSKVPFLTLYWLFKPEILDEVGNSKRKNAIYVVGITLLMLIVWVGTI